MDQGSHTARRISNEITRSNSTVSRDFNHLPPDSNICCPLESIASCPPYLYTLPFMKKSLLFLILFCLITAAYAQNGISGRVIDAATGEPLELAALHNPRTGKDELTDHQGHFLLPKPAADSLWITISFIGYRPKQVRFSAGTTDAVVALERSALDLRSVTITAHPGATIFRTLSRIDLDMQPARSAQDLLRLVPGLFIAQHQGGGKAEQIFLRGFDADHGTDVSVSVDGVPVNMVSHAHGQGYADLHFLIPETVQGYDFGKGPYYTTRGDLCTAGYVAYDTKNVLGDNIVKLEGGQFSTGRLVALINLMNKKPQEK